jgi:hypothetical protein
MDSSSRGIVLGLLLAAGVIGFLEFGSWAEATAFRAQIGALETRLSEEPLRSLRGNVAQYEREKKLIEEKTAAFAALNTRATCPESLLAHIGLATKGNELGEVTLKGTAVTLKGKTGAMNGATAIASALSTNPNVFALDNSGFDRDKFSANGTHVTTACAPPATEEARMANAGGYR